MSLLNYKYELSIWRDIPVEKTSNIPAHFQEEKVAVLAANDLHNDISAFNPILKKNINGEKTLTFSLPRNYKKNGELLLNPYLSFLTNERKIKLRVGEEYSWSSPEDLEAEDSEEKWMTFVIKEVEEDKKSFTNTYTAKEIYVNELGKNGWTTTLDIELENNYGTLTDLAEKILEGSDWEVDNTSYSPVEVMVEPLFQTTVSTAFTAINVVTGTNFTIPKNAVIYPAYNSVRWDSDSSQWVFITGEKQFLFKGTGLTFNREDLNDDFIVVDEDYNYNYTVVNPITTGGINLTGAAIGEIPLQAQIIIKNIDTHYDTTLEKYVKKYQVENAAEVGLAKGTSVFGYEETQYLVSEVVQNYLTNNTNFINTLGWLPVNTLLSNTLPQTAVIWDDVTAPTNYLTIPLGGSSQKYYNEGPRNLRLELVKDKVYVVRLKARVITNDKKDYGTNGANILTSLSSFPTVSARFVTYNYINQTPGEIAPVSQAGNLKPAAASGIDSTTVINNRGYANSATGARIRFNKSNFSGGVYPSLHDQDGYYYTYIQATETTESNSLDKVVFRLTVSGGTAGTSLYIEDIQVFDYVEDESSQHLPIFLNDIPEGSVKFVPKFYYINNQKKIINLPSDVSYYKPQYRAGYTAVRHIDVKESNYFNNLTSLAELFEVWIKFNIKHKKNGEILLIDGKPVKRVVFSKYTPYGDTFNYAGFKYGINLDSIKRSITSTGIATKVIVKNNNQQYAVDGMASIARAVNNPSKDNTIFNFDYYVNQGLLDHATLLRDLYGLSSQDFALLPNLKRINEKYQIEANLLQKYKSELEVAKKYIEMYESAIEGAKESYNQEKYLYDNTDPKDTQNRDRYKLVMNQLHAQANAFRAARDTYVNRQSSYETKITSTQTVLDNLSIEKNTLNSDFYQKYNQYILEGTWTDEKYIDDDLYYLDALKVSATNAFPKISYDIKVIDIENLEEYQDYQFEVGQRTYIEDTEFFGWIGKDINGTEVKTPYQMEVIISEYVRYFDDPSKTTVTIKNYKNQYEDLFQRMVATTNQLQYQSGYYAKSANQFDSTGAIKVDSLEQAFAKNAFILANSMNESVKWDSKNGIEVTDMLNTNLILRLVSRGLFLTSDGGHTWDEAITGLGINTKYLRAGEIDADKINIIMGGRRIFRWDETGISAFLHSDSADYDVDSYVRYNQYGIYGTTQGLLLDENLALKETFAEQIEEIRQRSTFSLTWEGLYLNSPEGGLSLHPARGLEIFNPIWKFVTNTNYKRVDNDDFYKSGDLIPLVTIGKFYAENNTDIYYGLRMRNREGQVTLQTDFNGNLWLANLLTIGSPDKVGGEYRYLGIDGSQTDLSSPILYAGHTSGLLSPFQLFADGSLKTTKALITGTLIGSIFKTSENTGEGEPGVIIDSASARFYGTSTSPKTTISTLTGILEGTDVILQGTLTGSTIIGSALKTSATTGTNTNGQGVIIDNTSARFYGDNSGIAKTIISTETGTLYGTDVSLQGTLTGSTIIGSAIQTSATTGDGNAVSRGVIIDSDSARFYGDNSTEPLTSISNLTGKLRAVDVDISGTLQSANFASGLYGWKISNEGFAEFENATIRGTLKSTVFTYDEINAQGGSLIVTRSGVLKDNLSIPSGTGSVNFILRDYKPGVFDVGDTAKIATHINEDEEVVVWLKITAVGAESCSATILPPTLTTATIIPAGTPVVNYGKKDTGYLLLRADDSYTDGSENLHPYGPYLDVILNENSNVHQTGSQVLKARLGDLSGINHPAFPEETINGYGLFSENVYLTGTIALPNAGISNDNTRSLGDRVRFWAGGNLTDAISNPSKLPFRVYDSGKMILGAGNLPAMTITPDANGVADIVFGTAVKIGWGNIEDPPEIPDSYEVVIIGRDILKNETHTTLEVQVFKNGEEVDISSIPVAKLEWYLGSQKLGTGPTFTVSSEEVTGSAQITCIFTS